MMDDFFLYRCILYHIMVGYFLYGGLILLCLWILVQTYSATNTKGFDSSSLALKFIILPEALQEKSQWTDIELQVVISITRLNLKKLDAYVSQFVSNHFFVL